MQFYDDFKPKKKCKGCSIRLRYDEYQILRKKKQYKFVSTKKLLGVADIKKMKKSASLLKLSQKPRLRHVPIPFVRIFNKKISIFLKFCSL